MLLPSPTDRLILRCWQDEDFPAFARMNADSRVMEYFPAPLEKLVECCEKLNRPEDAYTYRKELEQL